jgi:hypothetical protein
MAFSEDGKMSQTVAISASGGVSEKVPQAVAQITWYHNLVLMEKLKKPELRIS